MPTLRTRLAIIVILIPVAAVAAHLDREATYRDMWCHGKTEVTMPDGTRADCVTERYAVEIDFANKWAEGIGQALHYAIQTGKRPATALIIERPSDWRFFHRAENAAKKAGVTLWPIRRDLYIP